MATPSNVCIFCLLALWSMTSAFGSAPPNGCRTGLESATPDHWNVQYVYTDGPQKGDTVFLNMTAGEHDKLPQRRVEGKTVYWLQTDPEIRFTRKLRSMNGRWQAEIVPLTGAQKGQKMWMNIDEPMRKVIFDISKLRTHNVAPQFLPNGKLAFVPE